MQQLSLLKLVRRLALGVSVFLAFSVSSAEARGAFDAMQNGFGVQIRPETVTDEDLDGIRDAGISFVRLDYCWCWAEPEAGVYDWRLFDSIMGKLRARKLKALFIMTGGNETRVGMTSGDGKNDFFGQEAIPAAPSTADHIQAYKDFVLAALRRYGAEDIVWEIWNEPDTPGFWPPQSNPDVYAKLVTTVCAAMKAENPKVAVIGPASAGMPGSHTPDEGALMTALLASPAVDCLDALSVHSHRLDQPPETISDDYTKLRAFIAARLPAAHAMPQIFDTEWGYSTAVSTLRQQADYVARTYLINLVNKVPVTVWYEWKDSKLGYVPARDPENHFGINLSAGHPKEAVEVLKSILLPISGLTYEGRLTVGDDKIYVLSFKGAGAHRLVAWSARGDDTAPMLFVKDGKIGSRYALSARPQVFDVTSPAPSCFLGAF